MVDQHNPSGRMYVVDAGSVPWQAGETEGLTFHCQVLLDGADGRPEALRFRFNPTPSVYAHMHLTSQFQLLLAGAMDMPRGRMDLRPLAVHYTDHNVPYGPFSVGAGHDMLVLHPKAGGLVPMLAAEARRAINPGGRLIIGADHTETWTDTPDGSGRYKRIIPAELGPPVTLIDLPPGAALALMPAPHGRYEVVVEGTVDIAGAPLSPPSFRYVASTVAPTPIVAGAGGARVVTLTFDADAIEGGLTGDAISLNAADAMAHAI